MKVLAEFAIVPLGIGVSLSKYVAQIIKYTRECGLKIQEHSMGTNIEGEWDEVMAVVKKCNELLLEQGVPRVSTTMKISLRTDKDESMAGKLKSVDEKMKKM